MRAHIQMVLEVFNALDISMSDTYRVEESWKGWQTFVHVVGEKNKEGHNFTVHSHPISCGKQPIMYVSNCLQSVVLLLCILYFHNI